MGQEVFATSLETEYPRRFCIAVVQCVLRQLQRQNLQLLPNTLFDVRDNKMFEMHTARITALGQSRKSKLPPLMPDSFATAVFYVMNADDVPCALMSKVPAAFSAYTSTGEQTCQVPANSRFLCTSPFSEGSVQHGDDCFEVVFGLPWSFESLISKAASLGHPAIFCKMVLSDIQSAIEFHAEHTLEEVAEFKVEWCKRWLHRAAVLDKEEKTAASKRHPSTAKKVAINKRNFGKPRI